MAFNIIVLAKQVPDTNVIKINPKTGTLIRDGVPSILICLCWFEQQHKQADSKLTCGHSYFSHYKSYQRFDHYFSAPVQLLIVLRQFTINKIV